MEGPTLENVHRLVVGLDQRVSAHIAHEDSMPGKLDTLHERVERLEAGQRVIAAGHVSLTQQMAEVTSALHLHHSDMRSMREALDDNSRATRATLEAATKLHDVVVTASTLGKFVRWAGPLVVAAAVAWGVASGWAVAAGVALADLFRTQPPK